jgi:hypothetical protein
MAKLKPALMDLARRAVVVLQELHELERDVSAWRLAPRPFVEVAAAEAGLTVEELLVLLDRLRAPGFEQALAAVETLGGRFRDRPRDHHAAGVLAWLFNPESRVELAAAGLTLKRAAALAAWLATEGASVSEAVWQGKSPYPAKVTETMGELLAELARLNKEGAAAIQLTDLDVIPVGHNEDLALCRVLVRGTSVPGYPVADLVTRIASTLPDEMRRAA